MSTLTPELNLAQAVDNDDTADYLTLPAGLAGSLAILDGLFNQTTGHAHNGSHQGALLGPNSFADNTLPGAKLVDGSVTTQKIQDAAVTYAKLAAFMHESLWAGCLTVVASGPYTVVVASNVMFVWCNGTSTITLTSGINRPITVRANNAQCTVVGTTGSVIGGSVDMASGTVQNGKVNAGDALTFKWDGTNWAAV